MKCPYTKGMDDLQKAEYAIFKFVGVVAVVCIGAVLWYVNFS